MVHEVSIVSTLQDICIQFMRHSKNSKEYALSVTGYGDVAEKILNDSKENRNFSAIICIQTRRTMKDGLYQRGISCGYDVGRRLFLLGTYEGCICYKAMELTEWSGKIHLKDIITVIGDERVDYTRWKGGSRNLCEPIDMPYKQTKYLYQTIARWLAGNNSLFGLKLTTEFLQVVNERLVEVPTVKLGYI